MTGLCVVIALVAFVAGINAQNSIHFMIGMSAGACVQCWKEPDTNISDEWFRLFGAMNPKVLEESDDPDRKVAWKWVACFLKSTNMINDEGEVASYMIPTFAKTVWPKIDGDEESKQNHDKVLSIIKDCNTEVIDKYTEAEERVLGLYKCAFEKEIPTPPAMITYKFYVDLNKKCLEKATDLTKDDFVSFAIFERVPLTDGQLNYAACLIEEGYTDGGKAHVEFGHKIASLVPDENKRNLYSGVYEECLKSCDHCKESYDLPAEKEALKKFISYIWPCMLENVEDVSWDDLVPKVE